MLCPGPLGYGAAAHVEFVGPGHFPPPSMMLCEVPWSWHRFVGFACLGLCVYHLGGLAGEFRTQTEAERLSGVICHWCGCHRLRCFRRRGTFCFRVHPFWIVRVFLPDGPGRDADVVRGGGGF